MFIVTYRNRNITLLRFDVSGLQQRFFSFSEKDSRRLSLPLSRKYRSFCITVMHSQIDAYLEDYNLSKTRYL